MKQDLQYAYRMLFKYPVFTIVAVLSLAIGIGANSAVFSLFNALLLRPRPGIDAPNEIVDVGRTQDGSGFDTSSYPNYVDLRGRNTVFSGLAAYEIEPRPMGLGGKTDAERIFGVKVSGNYFSVLGVRPAAGRFFVPEEDRVAGERRSAVLSYDLWHRRFQKDPAIVGQTVILNGYPFAVVGVAQKDFRGTSLLAPDVWIPIHSLETDELLRRRQSVWLLMVGRLKPGITVDQAQASMNVLAASLLKAYPQENEGKGIAVHASTIFPGDMMTMIYGFLALLFVIVGLVLLIGCVNFAGMMLARATTRRREVAVRLALGAGRSRPRSAATDRNAGVVCHRWSRRSLARRYLTECSFESCTAVTGTCNFRSRSGLASSSFYGWSYDGCRSSIRITSRAAVYPIRSCSGTERRDATDGKTSSPQRTGCRSGSALASSCCWRRVVCSFVAVRDRNGIGV